MKGFLICEDNTVFEGHWWGSKDFFSVGEIVFNTSMQGYQEIITDPSYYGQIVVMTTPEQGNYGVALAERESEKVYAEGFVCSELNMSFSEGRKDLENELGEFLRPALSGVDTRSLTLFLRTRGTPWGCLIAGENLEQCQKRAKDLIAEKKKSHEGDWVFKVSTKSTKIVKGIGQKGRIAIYDYGTKSNIVEEAKTRFAEVAIFNSRAQAKEVLDWNPDGLILTNGPGDPAQVQMAAGEVKSLLGRVPIFGICMGHQILALAVGAKTFKLKFGHRGANHPVKNLATGEVYMTSQNHGYAVDPDLPSGVTLSQINLYDKTVEGIEMASRKAWSVQYHPEASPGPHDARKLFDYFAESLR